MRFSMLPDARSASAPDAPCIADAPPCLTSEFHARVLTVQASSRLAALQLAMSSPSCWPNQVELAVAMFAAWRLGAAVTPITPGLTVKEAGHQIAASCTKLLINGDGKPVVAGVRHDRPAQGGDGGGGGNRTRVRKPSPQGSTCVAVSLV